VYLATSDRPFDDVTVGEYFIAIHLPNEKISSAKQQISASLSTSVKVKYLLLTNGQDNRLQITQSFTPSYEPIVVAEFTNWLIEQGHNNVVAVSSMPFRFKNGRQVKFGQRHLIVFLTFKGIINADSGRIPSQWRHGDVQFPVDIVESGSQFVACTAGIEQACRPLKRLRSGCSIGLEESAGSLGCVFSSASGRYYAITAGHVILNSTERTDLDKTSETYVRNENDRIDIFNPAPEDAEEWLQETQRVGSRVLSMTGSIHKDGIDFGVDIGLVEFDDQITADPDTPFILHPPRLASKYIKYSREVFSDWELLAEATEAKRLIKFGRSTGLTEASLLGRDVSIVAEFAPLSNPTQFRYGRSYKQGVRIFPNQLLVNQ